ncbi:MAG: hypothetical protein R8P61_32680 [Bacteroidia bacterium]|nr:hypothetical protein [Bacteroidia bacterium]
MKQTFSLIIILISCLVSFSQDQKTAPPDPETQSKMEAFASGTGEIMKFTDTELSKLSLLYGVADTKVREIKRGGQTMYFYQISKADKYSTHIASIAYEDLLEVIKAMEALVEESAKDATSTKYIENKFVTDDGFQVGYFVSKGKLSWYLKLKRYGKNTLFLKNLESIQLSFNQAKNVIDQMK